MANFDEIRDILNNPTDYNLPEWTNGQYEITGGNIKGYLSTLLSGMESADDFFNVNNYNEQSSAYGSSALARAAVPTNVKKLGLVITYKLSDGWYIDQFIGSDISGWGTASNWKVLGPVSVSQNPQTGDIDLSIGSESFSAANSRAANGVKNLLLSPILEIGTIIGGVNTDSTTRLRTQGFINGESVIQIINPDFILLGVAVYGLDGTFINWLDLTDYEAPIMLPNSEHLYRAVLKKIDESAVSEDDLNSNVFAVIGRNEYFSKVPQTYVQNNRWLKGFVNISFEVVSAQNSIVSQPWKLSKGDILIVETANVYSFPILIVNNDTPISIGDVINPAVAMPRNGKNNEKQITRYSYIANDDCYAIVSLSDKNGMAYVKSSLLTDIRGNVVERLNVSFEDGNKSLNVYINSSNLWESARSDNKGATLFDVYKGQTVKIKANANYPTIYALLKKNTGYSINTTPKFVDWTVGRNSVAAGGSTEITVYEDCWLYVYNMTVGGYIYYPKELDILVADGSESVTIIDINNPLLFMNKGINSNGVWRYQSVSTRSSCIFEVEKGDIISLRANKNFNTILAFINDVTGSQDEAVSFANGTSSRLTVSANSVQSFTVNERCYLYIYLQADSGDVYSPLCICKTGKEPLLPITRTSVNLVGQVVQASLGNDGSVTQDYAHIVTNKLRINIGNQWYEKGIYLHCCCKLRNGHYGFNATKVVFIGGTNNVIDVVTSIEDVVTIPAGAYSAIVEFSKSSYSHFVCVSNQSILLPYAPYDSKMLTNTESAEYEKIVNIPGSISNMIDVALDYMKRDTLGYGDIATAFDDVVEPVESEFNPPMYEGEKMQINCSTFVMLCLLGIFYKNSRYYKPDGINIGNAYKFDSFAEYNYYYTAAPYQHILGANFGKMYANKLAKYAFDRGLLYLIKDDYSNIKVGDVLFNGAVYEDDNRFFKGIGHTLLVTDIEMKADGSQRVVIMENGAGESELNQRVTYGARFPLPCRFIERKNIVSDFSPITESVTGSALENIEVGEFALTEAIIPKSQFTLVVKANVSDDINIGITVGDYSVEINRRTLYKRGDGVNVKHFHFFMNSTVNAQAIGVYVNSDVALSNKQIEIESVEVLKGYFDE